MVLFGLLLVPILICGTMFLWFRETITWKEFLLHFGISSIIVVIGYFITTWGALESTEHLHGRITNKHFSSRDCCHCQTICASRNKDGACTSSYEVCDHSRDYRWGLDTTLGMIWINTCTHSKTPPTVWENAYVGEPATITQSYVNYLKADEHSLIVHNDIKKFGNIPKYPAVYGYYKVDPVTSDGPVIPKALINEIRELNATYGLKKQIDITLLLTKHKEPEYASAVEAKWLYGPKNSVNIIMGMNGDVIDWVRVVTISKVENLKIHLRDNLQGKNVNSKEVVDIIEHSIANEFKRTPMAHFEYLAKSITPSTTSLIILYIINIIVSILIGFVMHREEVF